MKMKEFGPPWGHASLASPLDPLMQLYYILGTAELRWNFSNIPKDGFDIHRFSNRKLVLTMCTVGEQP